MIKEKYCILLFLCVSTFIFGQQKKVETFSDSTKIKIGSQFHLTFKTIVDTSSHVVFPEGDRFGQLEVLESYPTDTFKKESHYELVKKYGLTQFDSGRYIIPSLAIFINDKPFLTDSLHIEVNGIVVDTLKQGMYDIKPIFKVTPITKSVWRYVLFVLLVTTVIFLVFLFLKKYKKRKVEKKIQYSKPIEKASILLRKLEQKGFLQKGEIKTYYSELTNIVKSYIEEVMELPAMESTTDELIISLRSAILKKKMILSREMLDDLEHVLKNADLVKFAKSKPLDFEIVDDRNKIEKVIVVIDKAIPEPILEELDINESGKGAFLKEERKKRVSFTIAAIVLVLFLGTGYFISTFGWTSIRDSVFGYSTKELLEEEWIGSDYGNPAVFLETPRVLKRVMNADEKYQNISEVKTSQHFLYGNPLDNFYINLITGIIKKREEINLEVIIEEKLKVFELRYMAKDVLVKQEDYNMKEGIIGKKAYGTMTIFDPIKKKERKMGYQILIFLQENSLQEITMIYRGEDPYATKISDRILSSIKLKKIN